MESFLLKRSEMAALLMSLDGKGDHTPIQIVQQAWKKGHRKQVSSGRALPAFLSTDWPAVLEKLMKGQGLKGMSLQEAAALGQLIPYAGLSITAMQNWVKRDFKRYFESPKAGKKYSLEQAALLFIIDDLKASLDFESIRKLLGRLFGCGGEKSLLSPVDFYQAYSALFEELDADGDQILDAAPSESVSGNGMESSLETKAREGASRYISGLSGLDETEAEALGNLLLIAVFSVQAAYFHSLSRRYSNATLFLN
ncbi:DUF1836 domain-containing protein [Paenibacillus sp. P22]|uniref:DUF1836 domain-containing protein n=1 Tax=Paenibacillus TaxID=44249 RepID=UPI00038F4C46|nr:DUF1836 domain-containing protein [Paenibacillus sp. P22]CDN41513.1 Uncharacterized protein YkrK [Paenibacillus sp. P22]